MMFKKMPGTKSVETKHMEKRAELFRALKSLDRRSFLKVSSAAFGAVASQGLVTPHSFQPVNVALAATPGIGNVVQGLNDVNQCIQIILTTPKGSDPLRPTFGADLWRYIDVPINRAIAAIVREVTEAITRWEPRVTVLSITATPVLELDTQAGAHLDISVTWQLRLTSLGPVALPLAPAQTLVITIPTP